MLSDVLEVLPVKRNNSGADRSCSESDQNVERKFLDFALLVVFGTCDPRDDIATVLPDSFCRRVEAKVCG